MEKKTPSQPSKSQAQQKPTRQPPPLSPCSFSPAHVPTPPLTLWTHATSPSSPHPPRRTCSFPSFLYRFWSDFNHINSPKCARNSLQRPSSLNPLSPLSLSP